MGYKTGGIRPTEELPEPVQHPPLLTPIEMLEMALRIFKFYKNNMVIGQFYEWAAGRMVIDLDECTAIVTKLVKDGYVNEFKKDGMIFSNEYVISFEGLVFSGYKEKQIIDDQNERRINQNELWLLRGTWFAGIAAILLLGWQIWIWFYPLHKDFPYWIWETIPKKIK